MLAEVDKLTEKLKTYTLADMVKLAYMLVKETYKLQHCLTKHARKKKLLGKDINCEDSKKKLLLFMITPRSTPG